MSEARGLVLIGGGHTHALLLHALAIRPLPAVQLTLINPDPTAPYTGMLPGFIAGHYGREDLEIDLVQLADRAEARLILGRAEGLDRDRRLIQLKDQPPVRYDLASLDIGITSDLPDIPGYAENAVSAKPLGGYARAWERFLAALAAGDAAPKVAIIGGGVAGVELALAMAHRLREKAPEITVIERGRLLPHIGPRARARLMAHLKRMRVHWHEQAQVAKVSARALRLADGQEIATSLVLGAAGSRPQEWLQGTGLELAAGFITVDEHLRTVSDPNVFAVGDCAHIAHAPRPKAGVHAVRQAPYLMANLRAALGAGAWRVYQPQRDYLKLVSLGDQSALGEKWGLTLEGRWLWYLKDRIDARFMSQFRT
ncbi:MAG: pyridine nucleotide-disulfide oxidoreductase [Rhodobacteraceae bacterium]|nr:MAG: pyridine nucleotide-disulfide oxidoreductase [Paracoccaceae bacterium]